MKITRRALAGAVAGSAVAARGTAQVSPAGSAPVTAPPPAAAGPAASEADDLKIQRENIKRNSDALAKIKIPETLEPSFNFKAQ